jgi:hypothetical protein
MYNNYYQGVKSYTTYAYDNDKIDMYLYTEIEIIVTKNSFI